jgi:hypothetical protein
MKGIRIIAILSVMLIAMLVPMVAQATPISFYKITTNGNADVSSQLSAILSSWSSGVTFTFYNNVGIPSSITDIYFDDGTLLGIASITDSGAGVSFSSPATPGNLPGANNVSPPFVTTANFSADSNPPIAPNGVNSASEWVAINFNLINGKTLADTIAALNDGSLRIGLHVQSIGTTGGSDSYVNTPPIPEPGTLILLGSGLVGIAGYGVIRRKKKA